MISRLADLQTNLTSYHFQRGKKKKKPTWSSKGLSTRHSNLVKAKTVEDSLLLWIEQAGLNKTSGAPVLCHIVYWRENENKRTSFKEWLCCASEQVDEYGQKVTEKAAVPWKERKNSGWGHTRSSQFKKTCPNQQMQMASLHMCSKRIPLQLSHQAVKRIGLWGKRGDSLWSLRIYLKTSQQKKIMSRCITTNKQHVSFSGHSGSWAALLGYRTFKWFSECWCQGRGKEDFLLADTYSFSCLVSFKLN